MSLSPLASGRAPNIAPQAAPTFGGSRTQAYTQQQAHEALSAAGFHLVDTPPNAAQRNYFRAGLEGIGQDIRVSVPHLRSGTARMSKRESYAVNLAVQEARRQDALAQGKSLPRRRTLALA